jgi:hypothetical protein
MTTPPAYRLVYPFDVPHVGDSMHWKVRAMQRQRAIRQFGELLPQLKATQFARVTFIRVQGPRQRALDTDNLRTALKGLRDALKHCGYIRDDSPTWGDFDYQEDASRRLLGPRIEVLITYQEGR